MGPLGACVVITTLQLTDKPACSVEPSFGGMGESDSIPGSIWLRSINDCVAVLEFLLLLGLVVGGYTVEKREKKLKVCQ